MHKLGLEVTKEAMILLHNKVYTSSLTYESFHVMLTGLFYLTNQLWKDECDRLDRSKPNKGRYCVKTRCLQFVVKCKRKKRRIWNIIFLWAPMYLDVYYCRYKFNDSKVETI